jgi:hypothetical protein
MVEKRYYYTLEGIFLFGEPLKIYGIEVPRETGGQPLSYHEVDFAIENNPYLFNRLMEKFKLWETYERLTIFDIPNSRETPRFPLRATTLWDAQLFSLLRYTPTYPGPVLGIRVDKTARNTASVGRVKGGRLDPIG